MSRRSSRRSPCIVKRRYSLSRTLSLIQICLDYLSYYFSLDHVTYDELPYVTLLANLLGKLDTEHYTASEIDTLSQLYLGRLRFSATTYENETLAQGIAPKFIVSASVLSKNLDLSLIHICCVISAPAACAAWRSKAMNA